MVAISFGILATLEVAVNQDLPPASLQILNIGLLKWVLGVMEVEG